MAYKNIFIDSDIILDVFLNRFPHYESSADVLILSENDDYSCCTSVHALLNVHYIAKKSFGEAKARAAIKSLTENNFTLTRNYHFKHFVTNTGEIKYSIDSLIR